VCQDQVSGLMKILNVSFVQCHGCAPTSPFEIRAATSTTASGQSGGSSWPRGKYSNGTRLIIYQPQVGASQPASRLSRLKPVNS